MPTAEREGLREALARAICVASGHDPDFDYDPRGIMAAPGQNVRWRVFLPHADALIAGPLSPILAQADTAAQAVADRDRLRLVLDFEKRAHRVENDRVARLSAEVERLRAERDEAQAHLAPFSVMAGEIAHHSPGYDHDDFFFSMGGFDVSLKPFRAARAFRLRTALTRTADQPPPAAAQEGKTP